MPWKPSFWHAVLALAWFATLPLLATTSPIVCAGGPCPRSVTVEYSLLTLVERPDLPLRFQPVALLGALASVALAVAFVEVARAARDAYADRLWPSRAKLVVAALGWATIPYTVAQFLLFSRRLEWMGSPQFLVLSATKVVAILLLPLWWVTSAFFAVSALLLGLLSAVARADLLAPTTGGGLHPAYLTPLGAAAGALVAAAMWWTLACVAVEGYGEWRRRR